MIPIVYSFSQSVSRLISGLDESQASSISASWLYSLDELEPTKQMDYLLHTFNKLFIEYDLIIQVHMLKPLCNRITYIRETDHSEIDALMSSVTSIHFWP